MVILNTCHIRDRAAEKVFSELGKLRVIKRARAAEGRGTILAVAGCVAQAEGREILARAGKDTPPLPGDELPPDVAP